MPVRRAGPSRSCRVSQARVVKLIAKAALTWSVAYGPLPSFSWKGGNCFELHRSVKEYLSSCPSSIEEERFAFQSIKKLLPASCCCMELPLLRGIRDTLTRPPPVLPPGYLRFVRRECRRLFRKGWDETYERQCALTSPPLSGCLEASRREGGTLGLSPDQPSFLMAVLGETEFDVPSVSCESIVVQSAGKPRPLTKFSSDSLLLRPLHGTIYDWLSKRKWLCRGDPTEEVLRKAGFREGRGVLTSGDYKSATDNLSIEVAELAISAMMGSSVRVPISVWRYAKAILRPRAWFVDNRDIVDFEVTRGQMMGSYLSFPLLCLQNYLAFRWVEEIEGIKSTPVLINGDDILFQSPRSFSTRWMDVVASIGLEVEKTKTSVSDEFGSLNSTLFRWSSGRLVVSHTFRFGMLRRTEYMGGVGLSFFKFLRGQSPELRWSMGKQFFSWHINTMRESGRLSADEWGFRGRLAWRIAELFSVQCYDLSVKTPPLPPCRHNVSVPPELYFMAPASSLSAELSDLNGLEMVSWKWSHEYSSKLEAIRWCLSLSLRRGFLPPDVNCQGTDVLRRYRLPLSRRGVKKRYLEPPPPSREMVFLSLLSTQDIGEYEPLPSYGEVEFEILTSVEKDG